jgi:hypothetical protein
MNIGRLYQGYIILASTTQSCGDIDSRGASAYDYDSVVHFQSPQFNLFKSGFLDPFVKLYKVYLLS